MSFLLGPMHGDIGRFLKRGCQMQNPLGKSRHFQPSNRLKSGGLGCSKLGVSGVELGLVVEDALVKLTVLEDLSVKPPVINVPNSLLELLVLQGWPLKGFPNPDGKNFWWVETAVEEGSIYLFDIGEVSGPIVFAMPGDAPVIKLFDPLGAGPWNHSSIQD